MVPFDYFDQRALEGYASRLRLHGKFPGVSTLTKMYNDSVDYCFKKYHNDALLFFAAIFPCSFIYQSNQYILSL